VCMYVCTYICIMYVCMYVCVCVCVCVYACIYIYMCVYIYIYACMHACMYVCIYVCMYVYMCVHMYVCMYTYTSNIYFQFTQAASTILSLPLVWLLSLLISQYVVKQYSSRIDAIRTHTHKIRRKLFYSFHNNLLDCKPLFTHF